MNPDYRIGRISTADGRAFVEQHHYSHGAQRNPICWGLFENASPRLIGAILFAVPNSENVRASVFGPEFNRCVLELHRLVILDETPKNTESWFVSRALKLLKQDDKRIWAVVSFADTTEGHRGVIYQALNAIYYGTTGTRPARFYRDEIGRLRHPRQNGRNIGLEEAQRRGWTEAWRLPKHRYLFLLPDNRGHRRMLLRLLRVKPQSYPKELVA